MDQSQIQQLAREIVNQTFAEHWEYWLLVLALLLVGVWGASWIGSYARKKAEQKAIDGDLKKILQQVEQTTRVTEGIKSVVSLGEWSERERRTLRRVKLEELLWNAHKAWDWMEAVGFKLVYESPEEDETAGMPSPMPMTAALGKLYFPELSAELAEYKSACHGYLAVCRTIKGEVLDAMLAALRQAQQRGITDADEIKVLRQQAALDARRGASDRTTPSFSTAYAALLRLNDAAADLMAGFIAAPEHPG